MSDTLDTYRGKGWGVRESVSSPYKSLGKMMFNIRQYVYMIC